MYVRVLDSPFLWLRSRRVRFIPEETLILQFIEAFLENFLPSLHLLMLLWESETAPEVGVVSAHEKSRLPGESEPRATTISGVTTENHRAGKLSTGKSFGESDRFRRWMKRLNTL